MPQSTQDQSSSQDSQQVRPQVGPDSDAAAEPHPPLPCLTAPTRFRSTLPLEPQYRNHPHFIRQVYGAIITNKFRMRYAEKVSGLPKGSIKTYQEAQVILARRHPLQGLVNVQVRWKVPKNDPHEVWPIAIIERFVPVIPMSGDWEGEDIGLEIAEGNQALTVEEVEERIKEKTRDMMGLRGLLRFRWFNLYELESEGQVDDPDALWKNNFRDE
ncbi:unnamed protein product [Cyclocybe aegerita]|uniref:Uncharacterized protein n=1 Tax=Cyclocybe aegerita TaxID=1973307 RepID=A0A8S0WV55_CYCAE|nr:unnamed protein product [Cyclocybe aegerita]